MSSMQKYNFVNSAILMQIHIFIIGNWVEVFGIYVICCFAELTATLLPSASLTSWHLLVHHSPIGVTWQHYSVFRTCGTHYGFTSLFVNYEC